MRFNIKKKASGDFCLFAMTMGLEIFGVIMVFSASYYQSISEYGMPYYYLIRSSVWAIIGFVVMLGLANLDYKYYQKAAPWILGISIFLLVLLLIPHVGTSINGAVRWIKLGPITIMPGELAKLAAIIFVAWFLSNEPRRIRSFKNGILPLFVLCGVYGVLILKQPNLSTAITVVGIILLMMFVAGLHFGWFGGMIGAGIVGVAGLVIFNPESHWASRITSFTDPFADALGDGFQVVQSLLALGSGGLFGVGLGKSIQKNLYLPEPQNDFILAIIGEELGFIGIMILMIAYVILIWRGIHIAINAPDQFSTLLASGIVIMIAVQVILNVAVVTSSMPPTGVILPFVSYGGNAQLIFMASTGILLNISRHTVKVK